MTREIWIDVLSEFLKSGTPTEQRLACLSLSLIEHPDQTELVLDRMASEILES